MLVALWTAPADLGDQVGVFCSAAAAQCGDGDRDFVASGCCGRFGRLDFGGCHGDSERGRRFPAEEWGGGMEDVDRFGERGGDFVQRVAVSGDRPPGARAFEQRSKPAPGGGRDGLWPVDFRSFDERFAGIAEPDRYRFRRFPW